MNTLHIQKPPEFTIVVKYDPECIKRHLEEVYDELMCIFARLSLRDQRIINNLRNYGGGSD